MTAAGDAVGPEPELRGIFELAVHRYHRARPRYPDALIDDLVALTGLEPGASVVEIGPATGTATEQLMRRGLTITGVELSPALAQAARHNLGTGPVTIEVGEFERWEPQPPGTFDAVVAATCWHWLTQPAGIRRAHRVLRPGGHLAIWSASHVFPDGGDPFFVDIQDVYERLGLAGPDDRIFRRPGELKETDLTSDGLFEPVAVRHHDWEEVYDADRYLDLLMTFSSHLSLEPSVREELFGEMRARIGARADGLVRRHWGAVLQVTRRR